MAVKMMSGFRYKRNVAFIRFEPSGMLRPGNVRALSPASSKTEDANDGLIQGRIDSAVKELKRLRACVVAKGEQFYYSQ